MRFTFSFCNISGIVLLPYPETGHPLEYLGWRKFQITH